MRILHILDHSLPVKDGYAFRSHAIMRAQSARGWHVAALTSSKHHESDPRQWTLRDEVDTITVYRTQPIPPSAAIVNEGRIVRALARQLRQVVALETPDILHAHSPTLNLLPALWVGRQIGIPVVYEMRASWEDAAVSIGKFKEWSWKYRLSRRIETEGCKRADHVAVLCDGLKGEMASRGLPLNRLTSIPNGVDLDRFAPVPADPALFAELGIHGKRTVGFIGTFFPWEGLEILVDAFARVTAIRRDVALLLIGEGGLEPALRRQVRERRLGDSVFMPGAVPQNRVSGLYAGLEALVYPRVPSRLTELVTPLKPLEAMAAHRLVLASNVGGHRELVQHERTGLLFKPNDPADLARTLERVLDDAPLRARLADAGHAWVKAERSWSATTVGYEAIYGSLINRRRPKPPY